MNPSFLFRLVPRLLLYTLPFISLYILSKRFRRYYPVKPYLFYAAVAFSVAGFCFLLSELTLALVSISTVSFGRTMSDVNNIFFFISGVLLYVLSSEMAGAISGGWDIFRDMSPFGSFLLVLGVLSFIVFSGTVELVGEGLAVAAVLKMAASFSSAFLLMLSFLKIADVYKRLEVRYHSLLTVAAFLVGWQFFMTAQRWLRSVFASSAWFGLPGYNRPPPYLLYANISITTVTLLLAFIPSIPLLVSLKEAPMITEDRKNRDLVLFVERVGKLIGGSAVTILEHAIERYNKGHGTSLYFDRNKGVFVGDMTEEVTDYIVDYFSGLIGPVATRLYAESRSESSEKGKV